VRHEIGNQIIFYESVDHDNNADCRRPTITFRATDGGKGTSDKANSLMKYSNVLTFNM
jgi:hypothetical protein